MTALFLETLHPTAGSYTDYRDAGRLQSENRIHGTVVGLFSDDLLGLRAYDDLRDLWYLDAVQRIDHASYILRNEPNVTTESYHDMIVAIVAEMQQYPLSFQVQHKGLESLVEQLPRLEVRLDDDDLHQTIRGVAQKASRNHGTIPVVAGLCFLLRNACHVGSTMSYRLRAKKPFSDTFYLVDTVQGLCALLQQYPVDSILFGQAMDALGVLCLHSGTAQLLQTLDNIVATVAQQYTVHLLKRQHYQHDHSPYKRQKIQHNNYYCDQEDKENCSGMTYSAWAGYLVQCLVNREVYQLYEQAMERVLRDVHPALPDDATTTDNPACLILEHAEVQQLVVAVCTRRMREAQREMLSDRFS